MIVTKRTQGRPPRTSGINGREKLIEATRHYLRTSRRLRLSRTEIAQGCGVTPALVSYYFKDKTSLIGAVTKPLILSYTARLQDVQRDGISLHDRLHQTVHLLVAMNIDDGFLVDHVLDASAADTLDDEVRHVVDVIHGLVRQLLDDLVSAKVWRASDPVLTEAALWGMCRALGESLRVRLADPRHAERRSDLVAQGVAFVCETFAAPMVAGLRSTGTTA